MSIPVFMHGHICDNWLVNTGLIQRLIIAERSVMVVTRNTFDSGPSVLLFLSVSSSTVISPILEYLNIMLVQVTNRKPKLILILHRRRKMIW